MTISDDKPSERDLPHLPELAGLAGISAPRSAAVRPVLSIDPEEDSNAAVDIDIAQPETDHYLGKAFGGYRLEAKIGQGGMGTVYKGRQVSLDRVVAVKILNKALYENREFIKRFEREAKSIAKINHPNIVAVYDFGVHDGLWYMVNEFVEGQSLSKIISDRLVVPLNELVTYMVHCLAGLAHVSQGNIVHRDIKPDNILITKEGIAKIADFGLAKDVSDSSESTDLTAVGLAMGTPAYMSPEQCMGRKLDGRSDQYALGVTAYFALTGEKPFTGQSSFEIMTKQREHQPPPPKQLNPSIPADISALVMRMIAKDPSDRFPDAGDCGDSWIAAGTANGCFNAVRRSGEFDMGMLAGPPGEARKSARLRSDPAIPAPVTLPEVQMPVTATAMAVGQRVYERQASVELRLHDQQPANQSTAPASITRRPATDAPGGVPSSAPVTGRVGNERDKPVSERHRPNAATAGAPSTMPVTCPKCGHLNRATAIACTRCSSPLRESSPESARDQDAEAQRLVEAGRHREAAAIYARLADKETDKRQKSILRAKEREARQFETERQLAEFTAKARGMRDRGDLAGAITLLEQGQKLLGESSAASGAEGGASQILAVEIGDLRGRVASRRRLKALIGMVLIGVLAAAVAALVWRQLHPVAAAGTLASTETAASTGTEAPAFSSKSTLGGGDRTVSP